MIQLVLSGSAAELQAKASEAMNNVMALHEQFGPPVLPSVEVCGDMLEFKCDDGWGHSLWMDWDVREGLLRARLNNGEELVGWCIGADMRRQLEQFGVYDSLVNATWLDADDDASELCEEEERWASRRTEQGLMPERVFVQRPMYIPGTRRLSEHVFEVGSIYEKEK